MAGSLGECVHVAGAMAFLRLAEAATFRYWSCSAVCQMSEPLYGCSAPGMIDHQAC